MMNMSGCCACWGPAKALERYTPTVRACLFPRSASARLPSWHKNAGYLGQRGPRATFLGASHTRLARILDNLIQPLYSQ
jgi:hypothetical protein